jgi:hypothetical protein
MVNIIGVPHRALPDLQYTKLCYSAPGASSALRSLTKCTKRLRRFRHDDNDRDSHGALERDDIEILLR